MHFHLNLACRIRAVWGHGTLPRCFPVPSISKERFLVHGPQCYSVSILPTPPPPLCKWKSHSRGTPKGLIQECWEAQGRRGRQVGRICASLPFVWGDDNKRKLFLAMDRHCNTRYMYRPDKERDSGGPSPPNKHCGVICSKSSHAPGRQTWKCNLNPEKFPKQEMEGLWLVFLPDRPWRNNPPRVLCLPQVASLGCHFKGVYGEENSYGVRIVQNSLPLESGHNWPFILRKRSIMMVGHIISRSIKCPGRGLSYS